MIKVSHSTGAYNGFCSIKRLEVFLPPLDGMILHHRVKPISKFPGRLFVRLSGEMRCESKEPCPKVQPSDPDRGSNPDRSIHSLKSIDLVNTFPKVTHLSSLLTQFLVA